MSSRDPPFAKHHPPLAGDPIFPSIYSVTGSKTSMSEYLNLLPPPARPYSIHICGTDDKNFYFEERERDRKFKESLMAIGRLENAKLEFSTVVKKG